MALHRGTNIDRMRSDREESGKGGGDYLQFKDPGQYLVYVCPPCREEDDVPYVEALAHFAVGKSKRPALCLDLEANRILTDERVIEFLETPDDTAGGCPRCELREETKSDAKRREIGRRRQFYMNLVLFGTRKDSRREWDLVEEDDLKPALARIGPKIWEGIVDVFLNEGEISNPEAAILLVITRKGTKQTDTEYKVQADSASIREPRALSAELVEKLEEALQPGGTGDLYKQVAEGVRSRAKIEAVASGMAVDEGEEDGGDEPPNCYKLDYVDDKTCKVCPWRGPCSATLGKELYPGHELKVGDRDPDDDSKLLEEAQVEVEQEKPPTPARAAAKAAAGAARAAPPKTAPKVPPKTTPAPAATGTGTKKPTPPAAGATARTAAAPAKPAAAAARKPAPPPPAEEEPEETPSGDLDEMLAALGYDDAQITRMVEKFKLKVVEDEIPATAASVLRSGVVVVLADRLPEEHPLYKAKAPPEEPETPPAARTTTGAGKAKPRPAAPPPPAEEEPDPAADTETPPEPGEGEGEGGEGGGDDFGLDELEAELTAAAKKKK